MPSVIRRVSDLRTIVRDWRTSGRIVGFVPTMGALHEGHASLVRAARAECNKTVVSIFVNPLQFDRESDLANYPRDDDADRVMLEDLGVDALFLPPVEELYPAGFATTATQRGLTDHLCGASRPGHFDGVLTVVLKLFNMVQPDRAYFGQKDYQQAQVVRRMIKDLDVPVTLRVMPIVREADGLALSSRNRRLSPSQREAAAGIRAALLAIDAAYRGGQTSRTALARDLVVRMARLPGARVDYGVIADPETLIPREGTVRTGDLVAVAVYFGDVRLIDNLLLGSE